MNEKEQWMNEKAMKNEHFKESYGWLNTFCTHNNIVLYAMSGKSWNVGEHDVMSGCYNYHTLLNIMHRAIFTIFMR